jgi:PAS domain S-box-containing protein
MSPKEKIRKVVLPKTGMPDINRWIALFKEETLSRKILTGVLPAVLIMTFLMGGFTYYVVGQKIQVDVQKEMDGLAQNTSIGLQAFFRQRLNDLESLSETPLIGDYCKNVGFGLHQEAEVYRRELYKYFLNFSERSKVYYDISYIGQSGRRVCSLSKPSTTTASEPAASLPFMDYLREGKILDVPVQRFIEDGPLIKRYAKPVFDDSGVFLGAVVLDCDMRHVQKILGQLRVGEKGSAFIEDENGNLVVGQRPAFKEFLFSRAVIPGTPWRVGVMARRQDFLQPLSQIKSLTLIFSVLACLLVMALIMWRVSTLLAPIREMVEGTQRFASGDLAYRFREPETSELKILAASFNHMAANLEQRNKELEQRLRQLTALRDMEEAVIQRLDEETILRTCLESVARGFGFDRTALYWVDHNLKEIVGRCLYGAEAMGFTESSFRKRRVPLDGKDILNEVVRSREAVLIKEPNPTVDPRLNPAFVSEAKTREFVMAPICGKDRVLGILTADNYFTGRPLEESDKEGLTLFANAVGLALENTMLFQTLAESEARYRTVLENSPEAVIGLSREHWITTWNRGAELIFGFSANEVVGKPIMVLFPQGTASEFKKLLNSVMEKGSVRDYAMPGMAKGGRLLDLSVSWGGAHQDFWMNKEWTLVIRDVTEAKKIQQTLIRQEKLSAVGQLISGIAHELNNPLQAVVGYADLLSEEMRSSLSSTEKPPENPPDSRSVMDDLRIITENAMRCQKIVENLLLFVRQGEIEKRPLDLEKVVKASMELLQYKLKKVANIEMEVRLGQRVPRARGNFQQIQQVFVNLINNACDAMSGWAGPKTLKISATESKDMVRVEVADSGPGVPESAKDRLFEPFFTTKPEGRGTGLGLAVCRQIMEDHGGHIGFNSQVGYGTTFWFDLPIAREEKNASPAQPPALPPVRDKAVLVVDDEPDVLSFLQKVVEAEGDQVEFAASLKEAADKAGRHSYDLVVADIRLGEGTGINLYENWSLWSSYPRPAFLFVTGDVINPTLAQEIEKKGLPLTHKPIDLNSFQFAIRSILTKK